MSAYRSCQEPSLAPVNQKVRDFGLPEMPGAKPGSGVPKNCDFGLPELPGARPVSGQPKMHDFGLPELPGARPVFG